MALAAPEAGSPRRRQAESAPRASRRSVMGRSGEKLFPVVPGSPGTRSDWLLVVTCLSQSQSLRRRMMARPVSRDRSGARAGGSPESRGGGGGCALAPWPLPGCVSGARPAWGRASPSLPPHLGVGPRGQGADVRKGWPAGASHILAAHPALTQCVISTAPRGTPDAHSTRPPGQEPGTRFPRAPSPRGPRLCADSHLYSPHWDPRTLCRAPPPRTPGHALCVHPPQGPQDTLSTGTPSAGPPGWSRGRGAACELLPLKGVESCLGWGEGMPPGLLSLIVLVHCFPICHPSRPSEDRSPLRAVSGACSPLHPCTGQGSPESPAPLPSGSS